MVGICIFCFCLEYMKLINKLYVFGGNIIVIILYKYEIGVREKDKEVTIDI